LLALLTGHSSSYFLKFFHSITKSEKASIILFSILFFPGTFIHELAHWLMAKILFVQTSGMEFLPQVQGEAIKLGSVSIAKTDPIRRLLIGVAPVLAGLTLVLGFLGLFQAYLGTISLPWWAWIVLSYLIFVIASTMFSSRKDMEGAIGVILSIVLIGLVVWFVGFDWLLLAILKFLTVNSNNFFRQLSLLMVIPLGLNLLITILGYASGKRLT
jgi:hypothetical protein